MTCEGREGEDVATTCTHSGRINGACMFCTSPHPRYGPCDGFGAGGGCSVCAESIFTAAADRARQASEVEGLRAALERVIEEAQPAPWTRPDFQGQRPAWNGPGMQERLRRVVDVAVAALRPADRAGEETEER